MYIIIGFIIGCIIGAVISRLIIWLVERAEFTIYVDIKDTSSYNKGDIIKVGPIQEAKILKVFKHKMKIRLIKQK